MSDLLTVYLEEYKSLKAEQQRRMTARDYCVYLKVVALVLIGASFFSNFNYYTCVLVAMTSIGLGWYYLWNDKKVARLGNYFETHLNDKLKAQLKLEGEDALAWETMSNKMPDNEGNDRGRDLTKWARIVIFLLPGILAVLFMLGHAVLAVVRLTEYSVNNLLLARTLMELGFAAGGVVYMSWLTAEFWKLD